MLSALMTTEALVLGILLAAAALALGAGGWWLARRLRDRYRELLGAVELVQRQATELRTAVEEVRERTEGIEERLASRLEPELARLGRHLEVEEAAEEVRRAAAAGRLDPEVAGRLEGHLATLGEEIASGGRPF
jgi:phage shock protein A